MNIRKPDVLNSYLRHNEINNYLDYLNHRYCDFVTVCTIGKSFEGRILKAVKIDLQKNKKSKVFNKKWIFLEAGTHAREWITISVALYCIYQLTEKSHTNKDVLEKSSFFIIPVVNADGYEYTHEKNRAWRKNRRPIPGCKFIGTDCNRNYDFHWYEGSANRNTITYRGDTPFSESETCAVRNAMQKLSPDLNFVISLHSYAQVFMYPWAFTRDLPTRWKELHKLAECGRKAILKSTGRKYRCGSISRITGRKYFGSIADYAFGVEKVPFVIVMELPSSKYGFQPPQERINDINSESWIGIKAMCLRVNHNSDLRKK